MRVMREPGQPQELRVTHWTELELPLYRSVNSSSSSSSSSYQQVGSSPVVLWGGSGSCEADPGGPLYVREGGSATLIGLATGGRGCNTNTSQGIFLRWFSSALLSSIVTALLFRVSYYRDWIDEIVNKS